MAGVDIGVAPRAKGAMWVTTVVPLPPPLPTWTPLVAYRPSWRETVGISRANCEMTPSSFFRHGRRQRLWGSVASR